ncbi:MAG: hypothetical protein LBR21_03425 [Propionibacteriaceae bacterium]|nr:hypothetical protein [Propionibacteriaceae bacterium]
MRKNPGLSHPRLVVETFIATRLLLFATALYVSWQGWALDVVFQNWDAAHYLGIAANGYADEQSLAFFPGWPWLISTLAKTGIPLVWAGVALALVFSALAVAALYRLYGSRAAIAWTLAPMAVFTLAPYTESMFCAAAFWAWERAKAKQWWAAGLLAGIAMTTRVSGLFLIGALFILAVSQGGQVAEFFRRIFWLIIPVAVLAGYLVFVHEKTGRWDGWFSVQQTYWTRGWAWPWESLGHTIEAATPGYFPGNDANSYVFMLEIVSWGIGLLVAVAALLRRQWAESAWVAVQVLAFSLSYWLMSVVRAVLLWFPAFGQLGDLLGRIPERPRRWVSGVLAALALVWQVLWAWTFFTGKWAG